jgi:hypothetical protein
MSEKKLTLKERIHRAQGTVELERKKAIHSWVHAVSYEREEFDRLWVHSDNATWGHNFGRMVGFQEIYYNHNIDEVGRALEESIRLGKKYPEYMGTDVRSVGASAVHCLSEGCVEAAEDGKSARGWFMTPGIMGGAAEGHDGVRGLVSLWEYYGCDFVYHNGEWRYIHEHVCPMFGAPFNETNWAHDLYEKSDDDPAHNMRRPAPCKVTDDQFFSDRYDVHQVVQHLIWECPKPYETLNDENSYSPGRNEVI